MKAAGILFKTPDGLALFLKRGPIGDHAGEWCSPGGKHEGHETIEETAIRETKEETGKYVKYSDLHLHTRTVSPQFVPQQTEMGIIGQAPEPDQEQVDFTTFLVEVPRQFVPELCEENVGYAWAPITEPPQPLHPGMQIALDRFGMDELGVARAMADGRLTSPQKYHEFTLWSMRVTGTGLSYRDKLNEYVWRDPSIYMNEEFVQRCNGLPVVMEHPRTRSTLNSKEFNKRIVGTIMLAYLVPLAEEVWGIARIYDDPTNELLSNRQLSTSPSVVLGVKGENRLIRLEDGSPLLIEGKPRLLDHLAICGQGVWDKDGDPAGISVNDSTGGTKVPDDVKHDADFGQKLDKVLAAMDGMAGRMDSIERRMDDDDKKKDSRHRKDDDDEDDKKKDASAEPPVKENVKSDDDDEKRKDGEEEKRKDARKRKDDDEEAPGKGKEAEGVADKKRHRKDDDDDEKRKDGIKEFAHDMETSKTRLDDDDEKRKDDDDDDDRKDARADSRLEKRLSQVERALPRQMTDEDFHKLVELQARADSHYGALGIGRAPVPLQTETTEGYRRRVGTRLKEFSSRWSKTNLYAIPIEAFDQIEDQIYQDSMASATSVENIPAGELREIVKQDSTGRKIYEFHGQPKTWMGAFGGSRRRLTGIRQPHN